MTSDASLQSTKKQVQWWCLVVFVLALFAVYWGTAYLIPAATMLGVSAQFFGAALISVALAVAPLGRAAFEVLALRRFGWRYAVLGIVATMVFSFAVDQLGIESEWAHELADIVREPGQLLPSLLLIGALGPLAEELVFRGLLYAWVESRWGPIAALVTSALAFAVIHWEPAQSAVALPVGVLLGWLRWRSNSLVPSLIAHAVNNSAFVVVAAYFDI